MASPFVRSPLSLSHWLRGILFWYTIPGLGLTLFNWSRYTPQVGWGLFASGLVLTFFGTLGLLSYLSGLTEKLTPPRQLPSPVHPASNPQLEASLRQENEELRQELDRVKDGAFLAQEKTTILVNELNQLKEQSRQQTQHKENLLQEYLNTISEQRGLLEKKQQYVSKLEAKVHDLSYEIKTLLELERSTDRPAFPSTEPPVDHPVMELFTHDEGETQPEAASPGSSDRRIQTPHDAALKLQTCVETAEKLTGNSHLTLPNHSLLTPSADCHAVDLRRLEDQFRNETSCLVALYSPQENRFFFINPYVKTLLGWSPEKFCKDFTPFIQQGHVEWKHALNQLNSQAESRTRLVLSTKSGENLLVHCHLARIHKGVFHDQVICLLYAD